MEQSAYIFLDCIYFCLDIDWNCVFLLVKKACSDLCPVIITIKLAIEIFSTLSSKVLEQS